MAHGVLEVRVGVVHPGVDDRHHDGLGVRVLHLPSLQGILGESSEGGGVWGGLGGGWVGGGFGGGLGGGLGGGQSQRQTDP